MTTSAFRNENLINELFGNFHQDKLQKEVHRSTETLNEYQNMIRLVEVKVFSTETYANHEKRMYNFNKIFDIDKMRTISHESQQALKESRKANYISREPF